jgi:hypothetical protein|nr:hypothetical protein [Syntrophobacterales bacterium]
MKIDPITGKAYLTEWQRDLNRLHLAGYSYGYVEILDLVTGELTWQVDAMKGDGPRVVVEMPTFPEAVGELYRMLIHFSQTNIISCDWKSFRLQESLKAEELTVDKG